jgi:hypothetical protein
MVLVELVIRRSAPMKRLGVIVMCLMVVLLTGCTSEAQWERKMRYVHPNDPRYQYYVPFADP